MCWLCLFSFLPLKKGEELQYAVQMMHANAVHLLVAFVDKATLAFKVVEVFYFNPYEYCKLSQNCKPVVYNLLPGLCNIIDKLSFLAKGLKCSPPGCGMCLFAVNLCWPL